MPNFACPSCKLEFALPEHPSGRTARCPACGYSFAVAAPAGPLTDLLDARPEATRNCTPGTPAELTEFLAPAEQPDELGRLAGYRVLQILGHGGMGVVFLAEDIRLQRRVAMKVMLPRLAGSVTSRQRFFREARAVAALENDHIVRIHDVGEDRGAPYLVMPLLHGESLEARLERENIAPVSLVLQVGREVAHALAATHARTLLHRDIKPANIWLEAVAGYRIGTGESSAESSTTGRMPKADSRVKVLDFGLARAAEGGSEHLTKSGAVVGTAGYLSPEQAEGLPMDGRSDLFSLGCVLYRMATGQPAFPGDTPMARIRSLALESPPPVQTVRPDCPPELAALIDRLLAKDPAQRPGSAADLERHLRDLTATLLERPRRQPKPPPAAASATATRSSSKRGVVLVGLAAVALVAVILGVWLPRRGDQEPPGPEPTPPPGPSPVAAEEFVLEPAVPDPVEGPLPPWRAPPGAPPLARLPFGADEARQHQERWAAFLKQQPIEENSLGMKLALIPPGEFEMVLSPPYPRLIDPRKHVRLPRPYALGVTEVTRDQFRRFVEATNHRTAAERDGKGGANWLPEKDRPTKAVFTWRQPFLVEPTPDEPVVHVTREDARAFCQWLSQQEGATYRLPTEAEWEFACRAGGPGVFGYVDSPGGVQEFGWFAADPTRLYESGTSPLHAVGQKKANPFGLYDVLGHVQEMCADSWDPFLFMRLNPVNPQGAGNPVGYRSAAWNYAGLPTPSFRITFGDHAAAWIGFRVLREVHSDRLEIPAQSSPLLVRHGAPLSSLALVQRPAGIEGLRAWSLEPAQHQGGINAMVGQPGGELLATAGADGSVRLWNEAFELQTVLLGHDRAVTGLAFSRDGRLLASVALDGTARLWQVGTGQSLARRTGLQDPRAVALSPDGRFLAVGSASAVQVFRPAGTEQWTLPNVRDCSGLDWSPDGTRLLAGASSRVVFWRPDQPDELQDARLPTTPRCVAWSADGKLCAAGDTQGAVVILDARERTVSFRASINPGPIHALAWEPDNRHLLSAGPDLVVWNAVEKRVLQSHNLGAEIRGLARLAGQDELALVLRDTLQAVGRKTARITRQLTSPARARWDRVALSPDGKLLAVRQGTGLELRDASTGDLVRTWDAAPVGELTWAPGSDQLAIHATEGEPALWVLNCRAEGKRELKPQTTAIHSVAWSPDGRQLAVGGQDAVVRVWDAAGGQLQHELRGHEGPVFDLAWSPDGGRLASLDRRPTVRTWDMAAVRELANQKTFPQGLPITGRRLAWSVDGRLVWLALDSRLAALDPVTGRCTFADGNAFGPIAAITRSPNGQALVVMETDGDSFLFFLDTQYRVPIGLAGELFSWLPDSQRLLAFHPQANLVRAYDSRNLLPLGTLLPGAGGSVFCIGSEGSIRGQVSLEGLFVYVVMTEGGRLRTLQPAYFARRFGNPAVAVQARLFPEAGPSDATEPLHTGLDLAAVPGVTPPEIAADPVPFEPGQPISGRALVRRPPAIPGLRSWSIELARAWGAEQAVAWSPSGTLIATASDGDASIRLWDRSCKLCRVLLGHTAPVRGLAWAPDGRHLASVGEDKTLRFWDAFAGRMLRQVNLPAAPSFVAWSPNGQRLGVTLPGRGPWIYELTAHSSIEWSYPNCQQIAWSADSREVLLVVNNGFFTWWNVEKKAKTWEFRGPEPGTPFVSVACSADGQTFAGSNGKWVRVWNAERKLRWSTSDGDNVTQVLFSPQGRLGAMSGILRVFGEDGVPELVGAGNGRLLSWSPDGQNIAIPLQGNLFILDASEGRVVASSYIPEQPPQGGGYNACACPDGRLVVTSNPTFLALWNGADGRCLIRRNPSLPQLWPSPDGTLLAAGPGNSVTILDLPTLQSRAILNGHTGIIGQLAWSPDGKVLASSSNDNTIGLWDIASSQMKFALKGHTNPIQPLAWSPDGKWLASGGNEGVLRLWDPASGQQLRVIDKVRLNAYGLSFHPDGRRLAMLLNNGDAVVLDLETGTATKPLLPVRTTGGGLAWSPDGKRLAVLSNGSSRFLAVWNEDQASPQFYLEGLNLAGQFTWLADSRRIVVNQPVEGGSVLAVDVEQRKALGTLFSHLAGGHYVCVGWNGHYVASDGIEDQLLYVALTDDGCLETYPPAAFARRFGWHNDSGRCAFLSLDP